MMRWITAVAPLNTWRFPKIINRPPIPNKRKRRKKRINQQRKIDLKAKSSQTKKAQRAILLPHQQQANKAPLSTATPMSLPKK